MTPYRVPILLLLGACTAQLQNGAGAPPRGPQPIPRPAPAVVSQGAEHRNVCRLGGIGSAWLALDYYPDAGCPIGSDGERFTGAVVARHAQFPDGAELFVCADQRIPRGWRRVTLRDDAPIEGLCQTSRDAKPAAERVMQIQRSP